jgi:hypothetical protein
VSASISSSFTDHSNTLSLVAGKPQKVYEICESDIVHWSDNDDGSGEETKNVKIGIDASAVGVQLRLIKNDGILMFAFEGKDGSIAQWTFDGMGLSNGDRMVATATTQTHVDPKECLMCGENREIRTKHEETQTEPASIQSTGVQTMRLMKISIGSQTTPQEVPLHHQTSQAFGPGVPVIDVALPMARSDLLMAQDRGGSDTRKTHSISDPYNPFLNAVLSLIDDLEPIAADAKTAEKGCTRTTHKPVPPVLTSHGTQTEFERAVEVPLVLGLHPQDSTTTNLDLKRKASTLFEGTKPLNKQAKSKHDSKAWPRHLYMECFRNTPIFKGGVGVLHIDVQESAVWFEGWYGRENMRVYERKQVNLSDAMSESPLLFLAQS